MKGTIAFIVSLISLTIIILITTFSCKTSIQKTAHVAPPLTNVDVPAQRHVINASRQSTIKTETGTSIEIPANAFVDKKGNPVNGEVSIDYREFHTAADVIASGITMKYDSAGSSHFFQTAGMFEIKGYANEEEIFIAADKALTVNMASQVKEEGYNFYALNTETGDWNFLGTDASSVAASEAESSETNGEIAESDFSDTAFSVPVKPVMLNRVNSDKPVLNFDIDYSDHPELKAFRSVVWQYAEGSEFPNPENNQWIYEKPWNDMLLYAFNDKKMWYKLELIRGLEKYTTVIQPVLSEKQYARAQETFEAGMKAYEAAMKGREEEIKRQEMEQAMVRSFQVTGFGIYNWDRIYKQEEAVQVMAQFKLPENVDADFQKISIYLISGESRAIMRYNKSDFERFSFNPKETNRIVAVLPGNKIAYFSSEAFNNIDITPFEITKKPMPYTFKLDLNDMKVENMLQLNEVIASI